jgi:uncharacterized membrane protein
MLDTPCILCYHVPGYYAVKCPNCGQENPAEASFCSQCGAPLAAAALVPGVGNAYGHGWHQLWKNFLEILLNGIIYFVIGLPFSIIQWVTGGYLGLGFINILYSLLVAGPVGYGMSFTFLKAARAERVEVADLFAAFKNYWNAVLANLLVGVIIFIGVILLIIPGIYFACKLAFTPYLVVDRKMQVIEAIKASWRMTDGHGWKVFLIGLLAIPVFIAGLICLGVGVIISFLWVNMAIASLYYAVSTSRPLPGPLAPSASSVPPPPAT